MIGGGTKMAGSTANLLIGEGQETETCQVLIILEAMKAETPVTAPAGGQAPIGTWLFGRPSVARTGAGR